MKNNAQSSGEATLSKIRILLWDIDGTLLRSVTHGRYKEYFAPAMRKVFGSDGNLDEVNASGKTDTQIIYEALKHENFTPEMIFAEQEKLLDVLCREMKEFHRVNDNLYLRLDGAKEILTATENEPLLVNCLLTGNLSCAAEIKLKSVGLWQFFENSPNAFGEISHDRKILATEAGKLCDRFYNYEFSPDQFIVIGDTLNDIECARHFGAKVVAVATGKNQSAEKLQTYKPDAVLQNLQSTAEVLELFKTV